MNTTSTKVKLDIFICFEAHGILTKNGQMFSLPHFHFKFKPFNISTILTSKLIMCVCLETCFLDITWNIYFLSGI